MNNKRIIFRTAVGLVILALALAATPPTQVARAATITVTTTSDGTGGTDCTLRDAITAADTDSATGGCPAGSGADTIELESAATYTLTITDLPAIHSQITIQGNGSSIERSSAGGTPEFRIFYVSEDGDLTLNELTVSNGDSEYDGGGIKNLGTLTINGSIISGNRDSGISTLGGSLVYIYNSNIIGNSGGGIRNNRGSVVINNSTISDNYDIDRGGGISNYLGSVAIYNSTISGNSVTLEGGGIRNRGLLTLNNSTVSNNISNGTGGGIWNYKEVIMTHSTISANEASAGGGIYNLNSDRMYIVNSIVAAQFSGSDCDGHSVTSLGYNLDCDGSCNFNATGDISDIDPHLGLLQDNGGPTWTNALLPGSPAIDAVPLTHCTLTTDQRYVSRPQGPACDIGSFEVEYVHIDIKPGSSPNSINLESQGVVPVAVLTTVEFDASTIDPVTVLFAGASPLRWVLEDVDFDGDMDLLFHFKTRELNLDTLSKEGMLTGMTFAGIPILGRDTVRIIP